jgi:hypothetical protein
VKTAVKGCVKPPQRDRLRTATVIMAVAVMLESPISRNLMATIIALMIFLWDIVIIFGDLMDEYDKEVMPNK